MRLGNYTFLADPFAKIIILSKKCIFNNCFYGRLKIFSWESYRNWISAPVQILQLTAGNYSKIKRVPGKSFGLRTKLDIRNYLGCWSRWLYLSIFWKSLISEVLSFAFKGQVWSVSIMFTWVPTRRSVYIDWMNFQQISTYWKIYPFYLPSRIPCVFSRFV